MAQVNESDYRIAQQSQDPKIRQEFLNAVDLEDAKESAGGKIIYIPRRPLQGEKEDIAGCGYYPWYKHARIYVYLGLFEESYPDMLSSLIDHEGHHARLYMARGSLTQYLRAMFIPGFVELDVECHEMTALNKQIINAQKRGLSKAKRENLESELDERYIQARLGLMGAPKVIKAGVLDSLLNVPLSSQLAQLLDSGV